jgi:hypothetical protein
MTSQLATSTSRWQGRLLRWIGCDLNPLRRTTERIEAWVVLLVIIGYVPLAMVAAGYAGHWARAAGVRAQHAPLPRQVAAVVLAGAGATKPPAAVWAPARWMIGGRTRTGQVPVPYGTPVGAVVRVWIDPGGHVTRPPLTTAQLNDQVLAAEVITPVLTAEFLALSLCAFRWYLNRRRLAQWDSDWRSIDQLRAR